MISASRRRGDLRSLYRRRLSSRPIGVVRVIEEVAAEVARDIFLIDRVHGGSLAEADGPSPTG
jgi:hypothetical protein